MGSFILPQINNLVSLFYSACMKGDINQIKDILSLEAIDVNYRFVVGDEQKTALHIAIENEQTSIVKLLLKQETIDVNAKKIKFYPYHKFEGETCEYSDDEDRESKKYPYLDSIEDDRREIRKFKIPPRNIEKFGKTTEAKN